MATTAIIQGIVRDGPDVHLVTLEAAYTRGFAGIQLLGNLTEVCRSGKERARAALEGLGYHFRPQKLVMAFTPAGLRLDGAQLDLPVALALALAGDGTADHRDGVAISTAFAAEVGLDGELRPVPGIVALALGAARAGCTRLVIAHGNMGDLRGLDLGPLAVTGFASLAEVLEWLRGGGCFPVVDPVVFSASPREPGDGQDSVPLFDDMALDPDMALAAMVVAAGGHSILLRGTPGSGKTMFAHRLAGIMEPMNGARRLECMQFHNLAGNPLSRLRSGKVPFRSPHHSASMAAILGTPKSPGEISLAHGGILFLDELPEFRRDLLESLREPLESRVVQLARAQGHVVWPADCILVAASNNCPCGWHGSSVRMCRCGHGQVLAYQGRMSGPLLDRIDIHFNTRERRSGVRSPAGRGAGGSAWTTADMAARVAAAAGMARERNQRLGSGDTIVNSRLPDRFLGPALGPPERLQDLLAHAGEEAQLVSARGLSRALRVARTLADLDTHETVGYDHFRQALLWQAEPAARARGDLGTIPVVRRKSSPELSEVR